MSTMEAFYTQLFSPEARENPYLSCLLRLTQITAQAVEALKSDLVWDYWDSGSE